VISVRLLVTRPEPDAARTAEALRGRGHAAITAPLLRMKLIADACAPAGPWVGVLATSVNAVRAAGELGWLGTIRHLPLLAVGERTAAAARAAGFADVRSADGDAGDLVRLAASALAGIAAGVLYLAGEQRAHDLAGVLGAQGIAVETAVVYRMAAEAAFPPAVRDALAAGAIDGVLHYSARTADAYLACAEADGIVAAACAPTHFCLSAEIAARISAAGGRQVKVAAKPDEPSLFSLIET
jgi:uroporphyrinogen-III synthase